MAIITWPAAARIKTIQWTLDRPAQVNRSAYTGRRQVLANPWHGKWAAKLELAPIIGETAMLQWRSFLAQLRGQVNTFRLAATEGLQAALPHAVVAGTPAAAGATSMTIANSDAFAPTGLLAGQLVTLNDQLLQLTADATWNSGTNFGVINFEPALRAGAAVNTVIETRNPAALVALTDSSIGWNVAPGKIYGIQLQVEEAF